MSDIEDRRQRAQEAFQDASGLGDNGWRAAEVAIETATRVRLTPEIRQAFLVAATQDHDVLNKPEAGLKAAFEAAGFEVEE